MLAVIFWHTRYRKSDKAEFIENLKAFHEGLKEAKPALFRFSATFETAPVPWRRVETEVYEDWYILSKFAGMDALDEAVLEAPSCRKPHEWLMKNIEDAKGCFYGLKQGLPRVSNFPHATWFAKPRALPEAQFKAILGDKKSAYALWARAMGAGPTPFCLLTKEPVKTAKLSSVFAQERHLVWSGA